MKINKQNAASEPVMSFRKVRIYAGSGKTQVIREQVMLTEKAADEYNNLNIQGERDVEPYTIKFQKNK